MSVSKPSEGFLLRGENGSSMRLSLHRAGDHNGNALPIASSSSSSSCSSSCLGESSPESLRSLSSLSGGRTDSPLDYDMFEVTLMATEMTKTDKMTDLVISKWVPEKEGKPDDNDDVPVGKIQTATELSESNDNSESVYLDANSCEHRQDTWDDNDKLTLALSQVTNSSSRYNNDELSSGSSNGRRHGSSTPDSDVTEIPADDDEEETLFLSVSSDMGVRRSSMTLTSSTSQLSDTLMNPGGSAVTTEWALAVSGADDESSELVVEGFGVRCPLGLPVESQTEPPASEDLCETTQILSSSLSFTNLDKDPNEVLSPPPEEAERCAVSPKPSRPTTSRPARAAKTKPTIAASTAPKTAVFTAIRPPSVETKRVSKLDLKDVEAKVGSRSTLSLPKTPNQNKSAPANGRRVVTRKEEAQTGDGGEKQRSSADPVKVAVVQKSIRVKCSHLKTNHNGSAQPERKSLAISQTLSTSTSSLGSELVEEGPLDTTKKAVQEVPDKHETGGVETKHPSEDAHRGIEKALKTEAAVEKPRNPSRKVSSKLGPSARQQGRGTRVDKGPSGPAPPPGSVTGTGPPGHGSPGPRQTQSDGSTLGEGEQSAGGGSPTRQSQSQSQGIPKPRTNAERASVLAVPDPATSNSKPTANQQPALGAVKRTATPATSKLPVKGLPTSLSSSALGSEISGAISKGAPAPTGTKPDEQPSKSTLPVGNQCTAKPLISSTAATTSTNTPSDAVPSGITAAPKPPALRSRALSLQARTTATGLKTPTVTSHNTAKTAAANQIAAKTAPAANQGLTKQVSQYPLQRSGSARLSRLNSAVDKNKPREAPARPTNTNSSSQVAAPGGGNSQKKHQAPPDLVPEVVNANAAVTAVVPVPETETTNTGSGTTGASCLGFKAKNGSRSSPKTGSRLQNASKPGTAGTVVADRMVTAKQNQNKEQAEKKNQAINQLRRMLVQGNKRVEALATVIQHLFTEREEALKQKKGLSLELANLREELVSSSQCCDRLQKEKEEVRVSLEEALNRQEEHHKEELVQLEDRLRSFYQTEWDKVHQTYQEEADKCRMLMEQQVEELRSQQEAERKNQEVSHSQHMESLKLEYETSTQELKRIQQTDLENLNKTLKETETSLSEKISELSAEKAALNEKLKAEEERRKQILTDKNLKDSHTVYLEQELESLKVVLEIKNNQLHHKEKKLMEMDKLLETNVKLQECLTKVQQENEDYKARMDKHAALSKQLSSEQAILQQTLQKESKVNKRLSMENEELLWKLHNGDLLASPRRLSPTSPFNSPRNSASFTTTAPVSPR
ncbi:microtubule-associated tumor suppressor 1 homolog isoform X2 [Sander lucioperca]|uniref:Microtubule-associated tumor suppressor 1 homolog n=1 Tax=Sander lucioperca TaxID=283035 RepID=A0A8D0A2F0_SANLU|nr:microtubule-associated tumor suppressor 1 homolog isoform X2 [Sander lucioperca]